MGVPMPARVRRRHVFAVLLLSALLGLEACGGGAPEEGAASPAEAVEKFADAAGAPEDSRQLADACHFIGPTVRQAFTYHGAPCARLLPLQLYYTGETTGIPGPTSFTVKAEKTEGEGSLAFVETTIDYQGTPDPKEPVTVLAVRESGRWWVATPSAFNPAYPSLFNGGLHPRGAKKTLMKTYEGELEGSKKVKEEHRSEEEAKTILGAKIDPCPNTGLTSARDPRRDVRLSHGYELTDEQPPSDDLVEVTHAVEGDTACFALRFAGDAPVTARAEFETLPMNKRLTVRWEDGKAVGMFMPSGEELAFVPVHAGRAGQTVVIRLPARPLGIGASAYGWAVTTSVPTEDERAYLMDTAPSNGSVNAR